MVSSIDIDPRAITLFDTGTLCNGGLPCEHLCIVTFEGGENRSINLDASQIQELLQKIPIEKVKSIWERSHFDEDYQLISEDEFDGPHKKMINESKKDVPESPKAPDPSDVVLNIRDPMPVREQEYDVGPHEEEMAEMAEVTEMLADESQPMLPESVSPEQQLNQRGRVTEVAVRAVEEAPHPRVPRQRKGLWWCCCW